LLYNGPTLSHIMQNWRSLDVDRDKVKTCLLYDISKNWKVGPFKRPPFHNFVGSPMGAIYKPSKTRIIHDLSWPHGAAVNTYIPSEVCSVTYIAVDDAVKLVKSKGRGALMAKVDLKDAYKQIAVRPKDWPLLGSTWINDDNEVEYYFDTVLPFGGRSSAMMFDKFACGLEFMMKLDGVSNCCHYLDDSFTCGSAGSEECLMNIETMLLTCSACGVEVNPKKVVMPTTKLEFLGVVIDSEAMELSMSDARMSSVTCELNSWLGRKAGTKRELLSLIGKLVFLTRVIRPGRIFLRRLITLSTKANKLYHKLKLSAEARNDILWWIDCAANWNGRSVFYEDGWLTNIDFEMYTDASGLGIGAAFGNHWLSSAFTPEEKSRSIAWRELFAVVVACATWGGMMSGRRLLLFCDNSSVVAIVNTGTSRCPIVMNLVRQLFNIAVHYDFDIRLKHVPGVNNVAADLLSRLEIEKFLLTFPDADAVMTPCVR
jgi:hypothetical protein